MPEACGTGTWGDLELDAAAVYVDIGAAEGGDGTEGAPQRSIQAGLDLAAGRGGGTVAVAAGTYPETLQLTTEHQGVNLAGRCRELVVLDASGAADAVPGISIRIGTGQAELSGLTVIDAGEIGIGVGSGIVSLVDLGVLRFAPAGLVAVRSSRAAPTRVLVEGCTFSDGTGVGVMAWDGGTELIMRNSEVTGTLEASGGEGGWGVEISEGAIFVAEDCAFSGNTTKGILISDAGTRGELRDCLVRDTRLRACGGYGIGLSVVAGATLLAEGCDLRGNATAGVTVTDLGTVTTLRDCRVCETRTDEAGLYGRGVDLQLGATLIAEDCEFSGNRDVGLLAFGFGTSLSLRDCSIRDTLPDGGARAGYGLSVGSEAACWGERCVFAGNTTVGVLAAYGRSLVELRDSSVVETAVGYGAEGAIAVGVAAQEGAQVHLDGMTIRANQGPGIVAIQQGTSLRCSDSLIIDSRFAGAVALAGAELTLDSSEIEGTVESTSLGGGVGIFASPQDDPEPPVLLVNDCIVADNQQAGVHLVGEGSYQLIRSDIQGSVGIPHGSTTRCGDGLYAAGVQAWDGTAGLLLEGNRIWGNRGAGLLLDDARAALVGNDWSDNDPDLWVQGEACLSPRDDYAEAHQREICPEWDRPSCRMAYQVNLYVEQVESGFSSTHR